MYDDCTPPIYKWFSLQNKTVYVITVLLCIVSTVIEPHALYIMEITYIQHKIHI